MKDQKALVFACSGCSHLATMANDIALTLDSEGVAEMSCISWLIAANNEDVQEKAKNRKIILIEGCGESCSKACLNKASVEVDVHINLAELGFIARNAGDGSLQEDSIAMNHIYTELEKAGIRA